MRMLLESFSGVLLGLDSALLGNRCRDPLAGLALHCFFQQAEINFTWSAECRLFNIAQLIVIHFIATRSF